MRPVFFNSRCYCASKLAGDSLSDTECNYTCSDGSANCGGPNTLSFYEIITSTTTTTTTTATSSTPRRNVTIISQSNPLISYSNYNILVYE